LKSDCRFGFLGNGVCLSLAPRVHAVNGN